MTGKIVLALTILCLTACGGDRVKSMVGLPLVPEETHLEGIEQTVFVGDTMTSSAPLIVVELAALKTDLAATTTHRNSPMELTASSGSYTLVRQNYQGKFYEPVGNQIKLNNEPRAGGLFLASEAADSSALYWASFSASDASPDRPMTTYIADLSSRPDVTISTTKRPPNIRQGFVSTLTYTGMAGGQIKFVYREFNDGLARAAFTQEVSLDYTPGKTYAYKSARFIVRKASASEVTFTLLQSL